MRGRQHNHHDGDEHRDPDSRDRALLALRRVCNPLPPPPASWCRVNRSVIAAEPGQMTVTGSESPCPWPFTHLPEQLAGEAVTRVPKKASVRLAHAKAIVTTGTRLARAINELVAMGSKTRTVCQPAGH